MKLEIKHLAPYLPYKLNLKCTVSDSKYDDIILNGIDIVNNEVFKIISNNQNLSISHYKPILKPLSDLTDKFLYELFNDSDLDIVRMKYGITIKYKMMSEWFKEHISLIDFNNERCLTMSAWLFIRLLELHFDVFGLIDKGLAIDINTINK